MYRVCAREFRTRHCHAGVFLCGQLYAVLCLAICSAAARTGDAAALLCLGLSLDDGAGSRGLAVLSDRSNANRSREYAIRAGLAGIELSGLSIAKAGRAKNGRAKAWTMRSDQA